MSNSAKKTKKTPSGGKYKARRFLLATFLFALAAAGGWFAYEKLKDRNAALPASAAPVEPWRPDPDSLPEPQVSEPGWEIMLVNGSNPLPEGYTPDLEMVTDNCLVDKRIADKVKLMFADAKASGINLVLSSAYRTLDRQKENFDNKAREYMYAGKTEEEAIEATAWLIARPGESEHHTGLALDIVSTSYRSLDEGFANTPAFKWLDENAHKYGFILRYPKDKTDITRVTYEPWHYRYVGEQNAEIMKRSGLCLEEYVEAVSGAPIFLAAPMHEDESGQEAQAEEALGSEADAEPEPGG